MVAPNKNRLNVRLRSVYKTSRDSGDTAAVFFDCGFLDCCFGLSGGFGHRMTSAHMLNAVEKKCDQTKQNI